MQNMGIACIWYMYCLIIYLTNEKHTNILYNVLHTKTLFISTMQGFFLKQTV